MKYIFLILLFFTSTFELTHEFSPDQKEVKYCASVVPKNMSIKEKKERFYALLVPAVQKVHDELMQRYNLIASDMQSGKNKKEIKILKALYDVKTNSELLCALKPHPQSIVIAQAAMESGWGTSRFFVQANNIFGVHSVNPAEPRIAAGGKIEGKDRIWMTSFSSVEESVRAYYEMMATSKAFESFRLARLKTDNPNVLVSKLDGYSEIGQRYVAMISEVIKHNEMTQYDEALLASN